ncbi:MAG: hypothetical protein ACRDSF_05060 [Pseudonocardiaceae bacterium]
MAIESDGHSRGNPRIYELIENAPKVGKSPTIWAWPEVVDWLRVAGQPVPGPWPPHQQPRPNPEEESIPVAVVEPERPARPERPAPQAAPPSPSTRPPSTRQSPGWPDLPEDDTSTSTQGRGLLDS